MTTALVHLPGWPPGIKSKQAIAQYLRIESSWGFLPPEEDNRSLPIERRSINNLDYERVYRYFEKCGQSFAFGRSSPHSAGPWSCDVAFQPPGLGYANHTCTVGVVSDSSFQAEYRGCLFHWSQRNYKKRRSLI